MTRRWRGLRRVRCHHSLPSIEDDSVNMVRWRRWLFGWLARHEACESRALHLPAGRVVIIEQLIDGSRDVDCRGCDAADSAPEDGGSSAPLGVNVDAGALGSACHSHAGRAARSHPGRDGHARVAVERGSNRALWIAPVDAATLGGELGLTPSASCVFPQVRRKLRSKNRAHPHESGSHGDWAGIENSLRRPWRSRPEAIQGNFPQAGPEL